MQMIIAKVKLNRKVANAGMNNVFSKFYIQNNSYIEECK